MATIGTYASFIAYSSITADVDDSGALSLEDLGFDAEDVVAADSVYIAVEGAAIRWWADGVNDPLTDEGIPEAADTKFSVYGSQNIGNMKIIAQSGTATLSLILSRLGGRP